MLGTKPQVNTSPSCNLAVLSSVGGALSHDKLVGVVRKQKRQQLLNQDVLDS